MSIITDSNFTNINLIKKVSKEMDSLDSGLAAIVKQIFSFLDNLTLYNLKLVCKNFKKIVNSPEIKLIQIENYETNQNQLKDEYKNKGQEVLKQRRNLQDLGTQLAKLKEDIDGREDFTFFESLTSIFNKKTGFTLFPAIKKKEEEGKALNENYFNLTKTFEELRVKRTLENIDTGQLKTIIDYRKQLAQREKSKLKMTEGLLGEAYATLPVLDLKGVKNPDLNFVRPEEMSAPIMKGQDAYGRSFIAIRAKNKETGELYVQTFFQVAEDSYSWKDGHNEAAIIPLSDFIMYQGKENKEGYSALKHFIRSGENEFYKLA